MSSGGPTGPTISLEQLNQYLGQIAQILGKLVADLENGSGLLLQPYSALLTAISALTNSGVSGQFLKSLGGVSVGWGDAVTRVALQAFTSSGTYTPTAGTLYALLGTLGSGGSGGGVAQSTGEGTSGSGGSGSLSLAVKSAAQIGASQVVTIGAAVVGGVAGNNNGNNGNDTSIGGLCVGKAGSLGSGAAANAVGAGGLGGVAGTGDITGTGSPGTGGISASITTVAATGPQGGSTLLGGGGQGGDYLGGAGGSGTGYGSGGGGARSHNNSAAAAGGNSSAGVAFALDFCKV